MREIQHMCEKGRLRATKITKGKEKLLIDASSVEDIFINRYQDITEFISTLICPRKKDLITGIMLRKTYR